MRKLQPINWLGIAGLGSMVVGALPRLQGVSFLSLVILLYLYYLVQQRAPGLKLLKVSLYQLVVVLPGFLLLYYLNRPAAPGTALPGAESKTSVYYLSIVLALLILLFLAYTNYLLAKYLINLGQATANSYFRMSGILTKIAAYTIPVLGVGMLFLVVAQPLFLIGCICFRPQPQ